MENHPFEWALGHVSGSPFAKLMNDPGAAFHYSNAGVAHLVLLFHHAAGEDLFPFLKRKLFEPIGETQLRWTQIGGNGCDRAVEPGIQRYLSPIPVNMRGSAISRCTRENGPASALSRHRTMTLPGRGPRSRPTTVPSGGLSRMSPEPRQTWS